MSYFSETQLRGWATKSLDFQSRNNLKSRRQDATVTIFLSHSHKDRDLVQGLIKYLATQGVAVYVDWLDAEMPRVTNQETANRIKEVIGALDVFMLLATENAVASRWVPWELGIADQKKGFERIVIVPVADSSGRFHGNEYIQIYKRLEIDSLNRLHIYNPGQAYAAKSADQFMREKAGYGAAYRAM